MATYRQIFMDGRLFGGPLGGDTLAVESSGFNNRTWLDGRGDPHTEALRMTERIRRPDYGHLEIEHTIEDA